MLKQELFKDKNQQDGYAFTEIGIPANDNSAWPFTGPTPERKSHTTFFKTGDMVEVVQDFFMYHNMKGQIGKVLWVSADSVSVGFSHGQKEVTRHFQHYQLEHTKGPLV